MPHTRKLLINNGAVFSNAYSTTPMCCPSRSSILTGLYSHNHHVLTNSHNCSGPLWQKQFETHTFATLLSSFGYRTGNFHFRTLAFAVLCLLALSRDASALPLTAWDGDSSFSLSPSRMFEEQLMRCSFQWLRERGRERCTYATWIALTSLWLCFLLLLFPCVPVAFAFVNNWINWS